MPELPEVETIVRMLAPQMEGKRIRRVELRLGRLLLGMDPARFQNRMRNQTVVKALRRGKYLVFELEHDSLILHLGMTGQLTFSPSNYRENDSFVRTVTGLQKATGVHPVDKHTHLILHFENGERVLFRDPRTFGKIFLVAGKSWADHPRLKILGPEPLSIRILPFLRAHFPAESGRPVKALLLDQSFLAGVGNIYADEALFRSGIHPAHPARKLHAAQKLRLLAAVKAVLRNGIRHSGASFSDYRKPDGSEGSNYRRLSVYGRGGQACRKCGATLRKTVIAQRGTVFCPRCQKLPR